MDTFTTLRDHLDAAFQVAQDTFAATADQPGDGVTPCAEFTVDQLRAHLLAVGHRVAAMGRGEPALSTPDRVEAPDGEWVTAFAESRAQAASSWSAVESDTPMVAPWRQLTASDAAGIYASELVIHSWDLARAAGQSVAVPEPVLATCEAALLVEVPAEGRAEFWDQFRAMLPPEVEWSDPFAPVPVSQDGLSALDRLIALSGRDPRWTP